MVSSEWAQRRAASRSDFVDPARIRREPLDFLLPLVTGILGGRPSELNIAPVCTTKQTCFMIQGQKESALCFDVTQSLLLKNLFAIVLEGRDYFPFAECLVEGIAVSGCVRDFPYAKIVQMLSVGTGDHYVHGPERRQRFQEDLLSFRGHIDYPVLHLVDVYLIAHELAHFELDRSNVEPGLHEMADMAFEFALREVCYEDQPNFERIANYNSTPVLTKEALAVIKRDLRNRRSHYLADRDRLTLEIACDSFALSSFVWIARAISKRSSSTDHCAFVTWFYLIMCISDLHQAMLRRGSLSETLGVLSEKPADVADVHFRKVAILATAARLMHELFPGAEGRTSFAVDVAVQDLASVIEPVRNAFEGLYTMPVTVAIRDTLLEAEKTRMKFGPEVLERATRPDDLATVFDFERLFGKKFAEAFVAPSAI